MPKEKAAVRAVHWVGMAEVPPPEEEKGEHEEEERRGDEQGES